MGAWGEGNGTPLQYSCLENPMDGGAWWAAVHGVPKSQTQLSDFTLSFHFPALEKEMATHSSVLAWRIPGTGEPHGLTSMGSHRVGHDWSDLAAAAWELEVEENFEWKVEKWKWDIKIKNVNRLQNIEQQPKITVGIHVWESKSQKNDRISKYQKRAVF